WPALYGDVRFIVIDEAPEHAVELVLRIGDPAVLQPGCDHMPGAEADLGPQALWRQRLDAVARQHMVRGTDEVWGRVDEGAVEVENESYVAHHQPSVVWVRTGLGDPCRPVTRIDRACQCSLPDLDQV